MVLCLAWPTQSCGDPICKDLKQQNLPCAAHMILRTDTYYIHLAKKRSNINTSSGKWEKHRTDVIPCCKSWNCCTNRRSNLWQLCIFRHCMGLASAIFTNAMDAGFSLWIFLLETQHAVTPWVYFQLPVINCLLSALSNYIQWVLHMYVLHPTCSILSTQKK